jgi:hypothetical protein
MNPRSQWRWLIERPHPWRRQLWVKGRKLLASAVWLDALTNGMGPREAAANWDLPQDACDEIFAYCDANETLIDAEANEERRRPQWSPDWPGRDQGLLPPKMGAQPKVTPSGTI